MNESHGVFSSKATSFLADLGRCISRDLLSHHIKERPVFCIKDLHFCDSLAF